ncbi:MAG: hypothetical protein M0R74_19960 [Dehalococcoidia bacterium]|nr:hypothetical protein [Dehalococcoidia bacterium]
MSYCFWNNHTLQEEGTCIFEADPFSIGIVYGVGIGDYIDQFTFDTESCYRLGQQTVPNPRTLHSAVNARKEQKGYALGGYDIYAPVHGNSIDGWDFATATAFTTAISTSTDLRSAGSSESLTKGYAFAGVRNDDTTIEAVIFATETNSSVSAVADTAVGSPASINSAATGFFAGGRNGLSTFDVIQKLSHSTEAASTSASVLVVAKTAAGGTEAPGAGYIMGGGPITTVGYYDTIETLSIATETVAASLVTLKVKRAVYNATLSSKVKGYCMGGFSGSLSWEIDGMDFVTDTAINPLARLSQASRGSACFTA